MQSGGHSLPPKEAEEFGLSSADKMWRAGNEDLWITGEEARRSNAEQSKGTPGLRGGSDTRPRRYQKLAGRMEQLGKTSGVRLTKDVRCSDYLISQLRGIKNKGERWERRQRHNPEFQCNWKTRIPCRGRSMSNRRVAAHGGQGDPL